MSNGNFFTGEFPKIPVRNSFYLPYFLFEDINLNVDKYGVFFFFARRHIRLPEDILPEDLFAVISLWGHNFKCGYYWGEVFSGVWILRWIFLWSWIFPRRNSPCRIITRRSFLWRKNHGKNFPLEGGGESTENFPHKRDFLYEYPKGSWIK